MNGPVRRAHGWRRRRPRRRRPATRSPAPRSSRSPECAGSNTIAPRNPVSAKNSPRTPTQNSLPSGSASTTCHRRLGPLPDVDVVCPELDQPLDDLRWCSTDSVTRSRWIGFFAAFASGTRTKTKMNRVPSVGSTPISSPLSSCDLPSQRARPEPRKPNGIGRIEGETDESGRHRASLSRTSRAARPRGPTLSGTMCPCS